MSDDIIVSGGGSVVVASDAILTRIERIERLGADFRAEAAQLDGFATEHRSASTHAAGMPPAAAEAHRRIGDAVSALTSTSQRAEGLYRALCACLTVYGEGESIIEQIGRNISAQAAWLLGSVAPLFVVPVAAGSLLGEGLLMAITHVTLKQQESAAGQFLERHNRLLTNPLTVELLRGTVMDIDEFGEGLFTLPLGIAVPSGVAATLDERGAVNGGMPTTAAAIVAIANRFGLLQETGVSVQRTSTSTDAAPPLTLQDRMARIPDPAVQGGDSRIRIDRYSMPGQPDGFDVYIAGTADFALKATDEPFDMTSNIVGVAEESPASYRAVVEAMQQAGVTSTSPLVLTGYSQGGLIASLVASSGDYDVKGLVTFGAPAGQIPIPDDVAVLTVRHSEDIVPATGGYDVNPQALVVQRTLFDDTPIPSGQAVPAHGRQHYSQTAALIDQAGSAQIRSRLELFDSFGSGAESTRSSLWAATRVPSAVTSTGR